MFIYMRYRVDGCGYWLSVEELFGWRVWGFDGCEDDINYCVYYLDVCIFFGWVYGYYYFYEFFCILICY